MKVTKAQITGKNWKTNEDTWGDLDIRERRDHELIRGYLNDSPEEFENESWTLRINNSEMIGSGEWNWKESWITPDGETNSHNRKQLWEAGIKLEPWIFGRTGKDLRGTLHRSSKSENDDEKYHQNYWDTPEQWIIEMMDQRWKNLKDLGERHMTDDNPFLRQTLQWIWD